MLEPDISKDEQERLKDLRDLNILDTASEERFNRIVRITRFIFDVPIVAITLVDNNRQWFKSYCGLNVSQTSRNVSFCGHAIHKDDLMMVVDATLDPRFADNPLVTSDPKIRFYAGMPVSSLNHRNLGTLCLIDTKPRTLDASQQQMLKDLASWVELELNSTILKTAFEHSKEQVELLAKMNSLMVDRELKMIELKEEITKLKDERVIKS